MEVSIYNNNINQQLRFFSNLITMQQQLDSKLIAFCTILTVAVSIMLSFKQSRCLLLNATTSYSFYNVKKCIRCFKSFKVNNSNNNNEINVNVNTIDASNNSTKNNSNIIAYSYFYGYTKYLKLKRLRNIASIASKLTSNTLKLNTYSSISYKYLFKTFNATFLKMKKTSYFRAIAPSSNTNSAFIGFGGSVAAGGVSDRSATTVPNRKVFFKFRKNSASIGANTINNNENKDQYCPTCDVSINGNANNESNLNSYYSEPIFPINSNDSNNRSNSNNLNNRIKINSDTNFNRIAYNNHNSRSKSAHHNKVYNSKVRLYKKLPLRSMSRAWGEINSINLPVWCRKPCFYFYSWMFNCNLDECDINDLNEFKNLSEFFRRGLKPDVRKIDQNSCLISPCDGKILHFGKVEKGYLEQVKGVNYLLEAFLGEQTWPKDSNVSHNNQNISSNNNELSSDQNHAFEKNILYNPNNCLYHCVIYLAPGDYHRFHSPADWEIFYRRHFPGELFSVNPSVARWLQGLFNLNERVVYYGKWKYGFFSMAPVGATNVGSIRVYMDEGLTTNNKESKTFQQDLDHNFCKTSFSTDGDDNIKGVNISRGQSFGEFNLGSTIVLVFEAPKNFEFNIKQNQKVLYGSQLGSVTYSTYL